MEKQITLEEFAQQVQAMRKAQAEYFRMKTSKALKKSIQFEKNVDDRIKSILESKPVFVQQNLFT